MKRMISLSIMILFTTLISVFVNCDSGEGDTPASGYSLRDIGPAGGLIFYINPNAATDGWTYLEAAPSNPGPGAIWGDYGTNVSGAEGLAIGTGKQNTADIVAQYGASVPNTDGSTYAAKLCNDLSITKDGITYNDWFLPSKDELDQMYLNLKKHGVGGFSNFYYWSSSESGSFPDYFAWMQDFSDIPQYLYESKSISSSIGVRACRRF